jgi:multidrug efflux system membrane fusion protein
MVDNRATTMEQADPAYARESLRKRRTVGRLIFRLTIMAALLFGVFGGFWYYNHYRAAMMAHAFATMKPPPVPIATAEATAQAVPQTLPGIGSIWAEHQVSVAPEIGGRVTQIMFQAGATVKAGDPLLQLNDQPDQGDLLTFKAQARLADLNLKRSAQLASRQYDTQQNVDNWQSQLDQANAGIAKTQAVIAQKLVRAPFGGVLGIRQVELGQFVSAGTALVTLSDLDTLYVNFTLPEQTKAQLSLGQPVDVSVDAFPGRIFRAKLTTIEPQIGADTRTIKLQATLDNPGHPLLPGMFANAKVVLPPLPDAVTVPETAVDYSLYGDSVFVVAADGTDDAGKPVLKVKRSFVKTGARFDNKIVILSGLKAGDRVAGSGQLKLNDGAVVTVNDADALKTPATVPVN